MLRRPSSETIERLRAAIETEADADVRDAMAFGLAVADLEGDDRDARAAAIDLLAGIRRRDQANGDAGSRTAPSSLFTGGTLPGAEEEEG